MPFGFSQFLQKSKGVRCSFLDILLHILPTFLLFLSMPLVLGSVISFVIMLVYIPIIAKRISNEEQVLEKGLIGYSEYKNRVKYKVIPYVW